MTENCTKTVAKLLVAQDASTQVIYFNQENKRESEMMLQSCKLEPNYILDGVQTIRQNE